MKPLFLFCLFITGFFSSCKKYLSEIPDKKLAIPATVADLQAILDNYRVMNNFYPYASEILADNYYMTTSSFLSLTNETHRNYYTWQPTPESEAWVGIYAPARDANVVLDNVERISKATPDASSLNEVEGGALFFRAFSFQLGAELFGQPYRSATAETDGGIALRLTASVEEPTKRSSMAATYQQIITDAKKAISLLPVTPTIKTRPSQPAACALLARAYLCMQQYDSAFKYADAALNLYGDSLMNFNSLQPTATAPIKRFNTEVIFHARTFTTGTINPGRAIIDSFLYRTYHANDLRKAIYYKTAADGTATFKGDYDGAGTNTGYVFCGFVTDELLLTRAECFARAGKIFESLQDLNKLLRSRWKSGLFTDYTAATPQEALTLVLVERRKELLFRGTRWMDLRRLKDDPVLSVTPQRFADNQMYSLPPNSPRYSLRIPATIINITGMPQNP